MFCPNCGAQNPDTSAFCDQCGASLTAQPTQTEQTATPVEAAQPTPTPVELGKPAEAQPMQPATPTLEPMQPTQPGFGAAQQPQQFQQPVGDPSGFAAPAYAQTATATKKVNPVPIIISAVSVVVVAFLVVLFVVIIPNNSGIKGKLRHKWSVTESGITVTYDFKKSELSSFGISFPFSWHVEGEDRLTIEMSMLGMTESSEYIFSISDDGRTLTLADVDYPSSKLILTRAD